MAKKKPKLIPRASAWYRQPIPESRLKHLTDDEREHAIATERYSRLEYIKDAIRELRRVGGGYEARNGFPLNDSDIVRLSHSSYEKIRRDVLRLRDARSRPHVEIKPRSDRQRKSTIQKTGSLFKGQKIFFFHDLSGENISYEFVNGDLQIKIGVKSGTLLNRYYFFKKKPRNWDDVIKFTKQLMRTGMREGFYKIYNSVYGEIGESASRSQLVDVLESVFANYNQWLGGTIIGWFWTGGTFKSLERREKQVKSIREKYRDKQNDLKQRKHKRIAKRLDK